MPKYTVSNDPAYTQGEAARGVDGRNSRIVYFWRHGIKRSIPYFPAIEALKPKYDQNLVQSHRHHTGPTGMQRIEKMIPDGYVAAGANPYYQLIQHIIGKDGKYTARTIFDRLVNDFCVLPDNMDAYRMLLRILEEMHHYGYVYTEMETIGKWFFKINIIRYKIGVAIRTEDYIYPWKHGFDPIMYHIGEFIKTIGINGCEKEQVRTEFIHVRYWLPNDAWLNIYLQAMKNMGYIVEFPKGLLRSKKPVQPFKR